MSSLPPDDARLEALLRREPAELPDGGFTLRVMETLPPRRAAFAHRRLACCLLGAATGIALAWGQGASLPSLSAIGGQVEKVASLLADPWTTVGLALAATVAFLLWQNRDVASF